MARHRLVGVVRPHRRTVKMRPYTSRTNTQPARLIKDGDDLEAQFETIVDALRRDVRRTRQQVDKYARAYQRTAETQSRDTKDGEPDEGTQKAYRRLKQLQLIVQHLESSAAFLLGSGIAPESRPREGTLEVAQRVLESLEAERQRLYRDVHDGPAQVLANAIFEVEYLERVAERAPSEVRQTLKTELASLRGQFKQSLDSVRAMIYDLRPPELTELGLAEALRNYAAEWESRCGIKILCTLETTETDLSPAHELAVYRILQEALQNVHKHAQANTVGVVWQRSSQTWALHVTDDGVGFDLVKAARRMKSVGLLAMRERAELIGGSLQIQSLPGKGTAVTLLLPTKLDEPQGQGPEGTGPLFSDRRERASERKRA
ncbi:MAG: sensor histidine kinase [Chloroflexi bacterium]|nr:MAG: sensor histidine kinase [Chloroflexota bacterium]TMC29400.1 MAG: sensor histidine kinase [Chloroflexota bacterium]TMC58765.1 MAG: sensor histidine kinase [Chloroflexota bacterium]TME42608.1 MAG: sensor histidine kinase [Chloroflexota bacterium]